MSQVKLEKQRVTVRIQAPYIEALEVLLTRIHLRRDAYLNMVLPEEVELLESLESNTEKSGKYLRQMRGALSNKERISVTLDKKLVKRMNKVCEEKCIVRDAFIEQFIKFLVLGDHEHGSCISPLDKVAVLLGNPRHEYEYKQHHHPYEQLSMTDEEVEKILNYPDSLSEIFGKGNDGK